jgi:hypoxanthine phosphoribosyltransferase
MGPPDEDAAVPSADQPVPGGAQFAHASEAEMARILDFYGVRWDYEPRTFPILWNLDGDVVESFSPDFYLPELDLFLEMTTLKQRLVRKKNRKLRRLRELYPDVRVKLFYARDFRAIMLKYGRLALADSLSGTLGQVMPDREPEPAPALVVAVADGSPAGIVQPAPEVPEAPGPGTASAGSPRRSASRSRRRRLAAAARRMAAGATTADGQPGEDRRSR